MDHDDRSSSASTVSGIYHNILQSPAPICMFYFAHPFGITTPPKNKTQNKTENYRQKPVNKERFIQTKSTKTREKYCHLNYDEHRIATYTAWPRDTWRRDYVLPPLVQLLAVQKGQTLPDLDTVLKTIRSAWNTPKNRCVINSRVCDFSESSSATSGHNSLKMGSGTNSTMVGPGLLRRRYSVPEIIMRKHSLAQQKSVDESIASSAPTPHHSPTSQKLNSSNSSANSSSSESNVSRHGDRDTSMRRQLLRRIWSKEFRQYTESRSGSWSPPMRRSQRRLHGVETPDRCKECSKIELACALAASPKRVRLDSSPTASTVCVKSSTNSPATTNRLISSSDAPAPTTRSSETTTTTSSSAGDVQHDTHKNAFGYMDASSVDEHDDEVPISLEAEEILQPTPSTNTNEATSDIIDSAYQNTSINDESINNSRIESDDNENRNDVPRNTNGHTTAETIEENGNDVDGVDQYVSAMLVNNLNSLLDTVNEPTYITPNNVRNRDSVDYTANRVDENENENESIVSTVVDCEEEPIESKTATSKSSEYVESSNANYELDQQNANIVNDHVDGEERVIYFPQYITDCKDDESIYSTQLSEDDFLQSETPNIIPVQSGSSYPNCDRNHGIIVSRSVHRTESMEAKPSSASPREDHGGNESDASLVDSLDKPLSLKVDEHAEALTHSPTIEKSQSFFVPIVDSNQHIDEHIDVAAAMPEKLREKLAKRQLDMNTKKKLEINKKQKKIQKIIDRNQIGGEVVEAADKLNKAKSTTTTT